MPSISPFVSRYWRREAYVRLHDGLVYFLGVGFGALFGAVNSLMAYSVNLPEMYRRGAAYVDRILKGARPADLPVERPTRFYFVINLSTAQALGLTIPPTLLFQADKVIK